MKIEHDEIVNSDCNAGNTRSRRKRPRRADDATEQRAEIELLRLQRAEISQRVWIALLMMALAIITALTTVVPVLVQQYAQQNAASVTTGPQN